MDDLVRATPSSVREACHPLLLEHGRPTEKVFVLLHGLSNCPAQYAVLARELFDRGHNVVVPRIPYHGEIDLMSSEWGKMTAEGMLESANEAVWIARGLGGRVIVAGLSVNGVTAAWMAQNRSDLDRVVLLAPFFAPAGLPEWGTKPLARLLLRLPNVFLWWNFQLRQDLPRPPYAYPRFPTRAIGETMWLGAEVVREARAAPPQTNDIVVITTASDVAADNTATARLVREWQRHNPSVIAFEIPLELAVPHDMIDPHQLDQRTDLVYPHLIKLLER